MEIHELVTIDSQAPVTYVSRPDDVPDEVPDTDIILFREWIRSKRSRHTQRAYTRAIRQFYIFIGYKSLAKVTLTDLQDFADSIEHQHDEPATQAQILAAIKSCLSFAQKTGKIPFNVGAALQLPQGKDKLSGRILSVAQVHRMLYEAEKGGNRRNYVMLLLLYGSGIRCEELCNLQWCDVQETQKTGQITVIGKRRKTRSIPLHEKVWQALKEFRPKEAKAQDYVFQSRQTTIRDQKPSRRLSETEVWNIVKKIAKNADIPDTSTHWLRHSHGSHYIEKGGSLNLLKDIFGHSTIAVTGRYLHARPEDSSSFLLDL